MHNGVGGKRGLMTAIGALITLVSPYGIAMPATANGANKTVRPLDLVEVICAGFLGGKTHNKLIETQCFLFGHPRHLPFGSIIYAYMSNKRDFLQHLAFGLLKGITTIIVYVTITTSVVILSERSESKDPFPLARQKRTD
jgi:hypothetical protein